MVIAPPPKFNDLRAGTKLVAGMGHSTILPDLDFETFSPAGFVWSESKRHFEPPSGAKVKGLPAIGTAVYSEHPDAEVLSCAYDLKDGKGRQLWTPPSPPPADLMEHVNNGHILEAWNASFEYWIWKNVCEPKYGWAVIRQDQFRCAAAKARAFALPGSLAPAGDVMNIKNKKDKDGKRLLDKFSMPRNPTLKDPRLRIHPTDDPQDAQNLYAYNLRDIEAEAEISSRVPDLDPFEQEFWLCDQTINHRGVQIDMAAVYKAIEIVRQAHIKYNDRLFELTGGKVSSASEIQKLRNWMMEYGVHTPNLDADAVAELLKIEELPDDVLQALEIRDRLGSAAVKKLYAMKNQTTLKGRIHDLFIYHSARTGRAAGVGVQPQNFPNHGVEVSRCAKESCRRYFGKMLYTCPWCGCYSTRDHEEWNPQAVEDALEVVATGNLECFEYFWGDAIATLSGCLRGLFIAAPGHDLICSDYSAIEGVVLAALAGEEWRNEVFRTHGMLYEESASRISGVPFEEFIKHKKETGQHHPLRKKIGKVAELACFDSSTIVLTKRGYIPIVDVSLTDELWDGIEWVKHRGVISKGLRKTIVLDGVKTTPGHPIFVGKENSWEKASSLCGNEVLLRQALEVGSENLPLLAEKEGIKKGSIKYWLDAIVANDNTLSILINCILERVSTVCIAPLKYVIIPLFTGVLSPIRNYVYSPNVESMALDRDAITPRIPNTRTTGVGASRYVKNGLRKVKERFWSTPLPLKGGTTLISKWTGSMLTEIMNRGISGSFLVKKIHLIKERLMTSRKKSDDLKNVYDIVNAGSHNRFTIKTDSGHLIVHNSGYQGWIEAWKAFGADEFFNDEEIKQAILAWREASPAIVEFWGGQQRRWCPEFYGLEGAAIQAVLDPGKQYSYRGISYIVNRGILYCQLLSGRYLTYHNPLVFPSERREGTLALSFEGWNTNPKNGGIGWIRMNTYGGKLTENVVQATARDILANAIVNLERAGYPVVLHVHDEIVAEVPEGWGSVEELESIMARLPEWAQGWAIKASGGWRAKRYAK